MQEWTLRDGKWQETRQENLEATFLEEGGLFTFVSDCLSSCGKDKEERLMIFSKKEEKAIGKIARDFLPYAEDRSKNFLGDVLGRVRKSSLIADYVAKDPNVPITKASDKQMRLAIRLGQQYHEP